MSLPSSPFCKYTQPALIFLKKHKSPPRWLMSIYPEAWNLNAARRTRKASTAEVSEQQHAGQCHQNGHGALKRTTSCKQCLEAIKVHLQDEETHYFTQKAPCWRATNAARPGANEMVADVGQIAKNRDTLTRLGRWWWWWWRWSWYSLPPPGCPVLVLPLVLSHYVWPGFNSETGRWKRRCG